MAFCRLVLPLLVLSVVQCYGESVPVFLWGDLAKPSLKSYPLITKSGEEFEYIAKKELHNEPFTVVFIEENLSVEDFSHKSSDGESAFPFLHSNIGDAVYIPSVENPLSVLKALANPDKVDYIELTEDGLSRKIEPESGRYLFISMKDALEGESRMDLLRRHNDFMEALFVQLQGRFNMLAAVYTAQNPSWTVTEHQRARRQANENATESIYKGRDIAIPSLRLYVDKVYLDNNDILPSYTTGSNKLENTTQQSTLNFQNDTWKGALTLNFVVENGYWLLDNITLNSEGNGTQYTETLEPVTSVYSLESNSYRCIPNVTYVTVNETRSFKVTFQNLKVQPFFNDTADPDSLVFGDSYNCVGFFSIPIWSGLFVVFILLSIVFYGIMMMMDIRTMDRFDDPKGKTITINTSE